MSAHDRAEHDLELALGQVLHSPSDKVDYVFIGWTENKAGMLAHFHPNVAKWGTGSMIWSGAYTDSIERKFPNQIRRKS